MRTQAGVRLSALYRAVVGAMGGKTSGPSGGDDFRNDSNPVLGRPQPRLRFPLVEQIGVQMGGSLARRGRPLLLREIEIARPIFGESIAYDDVRIVEGFVANAPTTLGNHIRIGLDGMIDDSTLVHELTHI